MACNGHETTDVQCTRIDDVSGEPEEVHPSKERDEQPAEGDALQPSSTAARTTPSPLPHAQRPSGIRECSGTTTVELHRRQQGDTSASSKIGQASPKPLVHPTCQHGSHHSGAIAVGTSSRPEALDRRLMNCKSDLRTSDREGTWSACSGNAWRKLARLLEGRWRFGALPSVLEHAFFLEGRPGNQCYPCYS